MFEGVGTKGRLEDCDLVGNGIAGASVLGGADPLLLGCRVHGGKSAGVGFMGETTKGRMESCDVYANNGANVEVRDGADPVVVACKIHDGLGDEGVLISDWGSRGTFMRNTIFKNATFGVGIYGGADPSILSSRIFENGDANVSIHGKTTKGWLRFNSISGGSTVGVAVSAGAAPLVEENLVHGNKQVRVRIS